MEKDKKIDAGINNRCNFIKTTAIDTAAFMIVPRHVLGRGFVAPSDRLLNAGIGVGRKGQSDLALCSKTACTRYL